jgi:S1-C subfamily serine protease
VATTVATATFSPAAKAGLKAGDIVVKLDGKPIASESDLSVVINGKKPGDKMSVTYVRDSKPHTVVVTLTTRPTSLSLG